jgi:hypothetical protein
MNGLISQDELSVISERLRADFALTVEERKKLLDDRIDEILDMLLMQYIYGNEDANEMLGISVDWSRTGTTETAHTLGTEPYRIDTDRMERVVDAVVADKTWKDRVREWYGSENGTVDDIVRIIETESHRVYNDSILDVGEQAEADTGGVSKTWFTVGDDRVRETHEYLEGETVPVNERFYTFDGDSAMYPGGFALPQNNINCRCAIWLTR